MSVWNGCAQPFAARRPPACARHVGGGPGLIDEDELLRIEIELTVEPVFAPFQDVRPLLLGGVRGLFLSVIFRR